MKLQEIIERINKMKLIQDTWWKEQEFPDKEIDLILYKSPAVAVNIDAYPHRWYETSVTVYKLDDGYLGIRFVTNTYSESMGISDCGHIIKAFEMEEVPTITYRIKRLHESY